MIDNNTKIFNIEFFNKKKYKKFNDFRCNIFRFRWKNENDKMFLKLNVLNLIKKLKKD